MNAAELKGHFQCFLCSAVGHTGPCGCARAVRAALSANWRYVKLSSLAIMTLL